MCICCIDAASLTASCELCSYQLTSGDVIYPGYSTFAKPVTLSILCVGIPLANIVIFALLVALSWYGKRSCLAKSEVELEEGSYVEMSMRD